MADKNGYHSKVCLRLRLFWICIADIADTHDLHGTTGRTSEFLSVNEAQATGRPIISVGSWPFLSLDRFATGAVRISGDVVTASNPETEDDIPRHVDHLTCKCFVNWSRCL